MDTAGTQSGENGKILAELLDAGRTRRADHAHSAFGKKIAAIFNVDEALLGIAMAEFGPVPLSRGKRLFDILVSSLMLLAAAPLMALIVVLIKLDSEGPVFYSQVRTGLNRRKSNRRYDPSLPYSLQNRRHSAFYGKPFRILKFRSMRTDAEAKGKAVWCKTGDPRITRVGYWLRKTHLDELPQLINILKGEMSLVGPRPERPELIETLRYKIPNYEARLRVQPGLTGLAQTRYRSDERLYDVKKKVKYDILYMKNRSLRLDFAIMLRTVPLMLGMSATQNRELDRTILFQPVKKFVPLPWD